MAASYYVYIVRCSDDTLYTGYTTHVAKRVATHNSGRGAKYTRSRTPVELVAQASFETKHDAMRAEAFIKQLPRKTKLVGITLYEKDPLSFEKWIQALLG